MNNVDISAFPVTGEHREGLTKREYFTAMALNGLCASTNRFWDASDTTRQELAAVAVKLADETLAKLEKTK